MTGSKSALFFRRTFSEYSWPCTWQSSSDTNLPRCETLPTPSAYEMTVESAFSSRKFVLSATEARRVEARSRRSAQASRAASRLRSASACWTTGIA